MSHLGFLFVTNDTKSKITSFTKKKRDAKLKQDTHECDWGIAKYSSDKGVISLIDLRKSVSNIFHLYDKIPYEIYCLKGDLFNCFERFSSILEAEIRMSELLDH